MAEQFATAKDGNKLHYTTRGNGAPLALIMGFSGQGRDWGEPLLGLLERQFKLLVIDNRGTGQSDKPDDPITLVDLAADAASVLDHADLSRAHMFGVSMGGMIAQKFALNFPDRLRGLVLGCTNCGASHSVQPPPEVVMVLMPDPELSLEENRRRSMSVACSKSYFESERGQAFIARMFAEATNITPMHTFNRQMEAITQFDSFDRLAEIKAPTLVLSGDADLLVPLRNSEILNEQITGSRLHILKGAGHMFPWETPEEAAAAVTTFLEGVDRATSR